jgi:AbrB family looped-hinge helix DNA binding protein
MNVAITKMSENGQVVIPKDIRKDANIPPSTQFLVFNQGGNILLKRITTQKLAQNMQLIENIEHSEREIKAGDVIKADTSMSDEQIDQLLTE